MLRRPGQPLDALLFVTLDHLPLEQQLSQEILRMRISGLGGGIDVIHSLRPGSHGGWSDYTKETLSELESVGMLTLIECVRNGGYDSSKGAFGTYNVPFLDGAMRRHLEASMGTLSLDRDSMGLVRKVQMLYHRDGKEMSEIAGELGVSLAEVAKAVAYPTHFSLSMTYRARRRTEIFLSISCLIGCLHLRRRSSFGRLR